MPFTTLKPTVVTCPVDHGDKTKSTVVFAELPPWELKNHTGENTHLPRWELKITRVKIPFTTVGNRKIKQVKVEIVGLPWWNNIHGKIFNSHGGKQVVFPWW